MIALMRTDSGLTYERLRAVDMSRDVAVLDDGQEIALRDVPVSQLLAVSLAASCQDDWNLVEYLKGLTPAVFVEHLGAAIVCSMDPTVNAVGVEACLRETHDTLSGLDAETFRREIAVSKCCEALHPGFLFRIAEAQGMARAYVEADCFVEAG